MKSSVKEITYGSIFVLLMSLSGGLLKIYAPFLPFSLQPIIVILAGFILNPRTAFLCQAAYLFLGLIGLPVFTSGGGIGYVLTPSFGYILGFVVSCYIVSVIRTKLKKKTGLTLLTISLIGLISIYIIGVPYMYVILRYIGGNTGISFITTLTGNIVYFAKDILSIVLLNPVIKLIYKIKKIE